MSKLTPECPYCGKYIDRPKDTMTEFGPIISGKCNCGAVYVCDPTGHNVGEAYNEAVALAKGDWDIGELDSDAYDMREMDYDMKSHIRVSVKGMNFHAGKLIFIKMLQSSGQPGERNAEEASAQPAAETCIVPDDPAFTGMKLKEQVRYLIEKGLLNAVGKLALKDKNVIKWLISFSYDKEDSLTWRAIEAMGYVARDLRASHLMILRETVRRLLWSMSDESGGIGWSAPEMLGEIIRSDPDEFMDIIPILWSNREEASFKVGALWALARVACVRPDMVTFKAGDLEELASDPNPEVRGYAALLAGATELEGKTEILKKLSADSGSLRFYSGGFLRETTVSELARKNC
jgi:hypothetical protein